MYAKKSASMKVVVLLLAVVLLVGCTIGGTLAYLMAKSDVVTNTFVAGNIGTLTLDETTGNSYIVIPGVNITKNPVVTFKDYNVDAYVFLKVDASGWTVSGADTTYTYSIGSKQEMKWVLDGWKELEDGVYYNEVAAGDGEKTWAVIQNNTITVSSEITKDNISDYTKGLTFTAYAIQQEDGGSDNGGKFTPAEAWTQAQNTTN